MSRPTYLPDAQLGHVLLLYISFIAIPTRRLRILPSSRLTSSSTGIKTSGSAEATRHTEPSAIRSTTESRASSTLPSQCPSTAYVPCRRPPSQLATSPTCLPATLRRRWHVRLHATPPRYLSNESPGSKTCVQPPTQLPETPALAPMRALTAQRRTQTASPALPA